MAWAITTKQSRYTGNIGYRDETNKKMIAKEKTKQNKNI